MFSDRLFWLIIFAFICDIKQHSERLPVLWAAAVTG
jgi:hypothetical protein